MSTTSNQPPITCISELEEDLVVKLRKWVENEADFYGNTDDGFLLAFLRGCKYDMEKSKKKMRKYYELRVKIPEWCANKNVLDEKMQTNIKYNVSVAMNDPPIGKKFPTLLLSRASKFPRHSIDIDEFLKSHATLLEMSMYRQNIQLNGIIWMVDWNDLPIWVIPQMLSLRILKNIVQSVLFSTPLQLKGVCFINSPIYVQTMWKISKPFVTQKIKKRVKIFRHDWKSHINDVIPPEYLPNEYNGTAGPISQYEESCYESAMEYAEYLFEDNKYGFRLKN